MDDYFKNDGDMIHVDAYTKDDGTHVNEYWRRKRGNGGFTNGGFWDEKYSDGIHNGGFAHPNPMREIEAPYNYQLGGFVPPYMQNNGGILPEQNSFLSYKKLNNMFTNQYMKNNIMKEIAKNGLNALDQIPTSVKNKLEDGLIFGVEHFDKKFTDIIAKPFSKVMDSPDAFELYKVGSPNFNYNPDYVRNNGELYNSTKELGDEKLAKKIQAWLLYEKTGMTDCKVLKLEPNSSLSQKIANSQEIKDILKHDIKMLRYAKVLPSTKINFQTPDLHNSMHGCDLTYAKLDKEGNLIMRFEDLWNFNEGRTSVKNRVGEALQKRGLLIPYYLVVDVKIPKSELDMY